MFHFNALLSRMKYIPRWGLMKQSATEDLAQHTTQVMFIAHTLAILANEKFGQNIKEEELVLCCLYHDISEILTGDMPTPVKYKDSTLKKAYKNIEQAAAVTLLETAQPCVQNKLRPYVLASNLSEEEKGILKAADRLSALIKCIEELRSGNLEFKSAYHSIYDSIQEMHIPCVDYFLETMLPGYQLCLDELVQF